MVHKLSLFDAYIVFCFIKGLITSPDGKIPTKTDLEGFWDLVMLQIVDVGSHFEKIEKLRKNNWIDVEPEDLKVLY